MCCRAVPLLLALLLLTAGSAAPAATRDASCGNGLLDAGETCQQCPADCRVQPCQPGKTTADFAVTLTPPMDQDPSTAVLRIAYRSDILTLPGSGTDIALRQRVKGPPDNPVSLANDLDYAVRIVLARPKRLPPGELVTVQFDACAGARPPTTADLSCVVEACASANGPIDGCTCSIR